MKDKMYFLRSLDGEEGPSIRKVRTSNTWGLLEAVVLKLEVRHQQNKREYPKVKKERRFVFANERAKERARRKKQNMPRSQGYGG